MKDNIAFGAVFLTMLIGALAVAIWTPLTYMDVEILTRLNAQWWFKPAKLVDVQYVDPVSIIRYRDPPESRPANVAVVRTYRDPDAARDAAVSIIGSTQNRNANRVK